MRCPECGTSQPPADACRQCGAPIAGARSGSSTRPRTTAAPVRAREGERAVVRRVGVVLMVVGLADVAFMVYCVANGISYSSSLNLFALIAGVFLYRGSLTAARVSAHAAALLAGGTLVGLLVAPFLVPVRLVLVGFKTAPASSALGWILALVVPMLSLWVVRQLTSDAVTDAMDTPLRASYSLLAGALLMLVLTFVVSRFLRGGPSEQVLAEARQQLGPEYEYFISQMTTTAGRDGESVRALVL